MNVNKTEITICLGSSCFARGNKKMVQVIQQFLKQNFLEDRVLFRGAHCFGECGDGPSIRIGDNTLRSGDEEAVISYLKNHFGL